MKGRQAAWNAATQQRISTTSTAIGGIKNIKMLGLQSPIQEKILDLRVHELEMAKAVRWIATLYNASGKCLV